MGCLFGESLQFRFTYLTENLTNCIYISECVFFLNFLLTFISFWKSNKNKTKKLWLWKVIRHHFHILSVLLVETCPCSRVSFSDLGCAKGRPVRRKWCRQGHTAQEHRGDVRLLNRRRSRLELGAFTCPGRYREEATADVNVTLEICRRTVRSVILRFFSPVNPNRLRDRLGDMTPAFSFN